MHWSSTIRSTETPFDIVVLVIVFRLRSHWAREFGRRDTWDILMPIIIELLLIGRDERTSQRADGRLGSNIEGS